MPGYIKYMCCLLLCISVLCCITDKSELQSGGSFTYQGTRYAIKQARMELQGDLYGPKTSVMQLDFSQSSLTINEVGISGYGALLDLQLLIDTTTLYGDYIVSSLASEWAIVPDSSQFRLYMQDRSDTLEISITGGQLTISPHSLGDSYSFRLLTDNGDSLIGSYVGTTVYNSIVDGDTVGTVTIDTLTYALKKGDLYCYGDLFQENLYYYEYYLYSTNMRYTDKGNYKNGFYLVLGLQSSNGTHPESGVYPIVTYYAPQTALYGHRDGSVNWGTYWQTFANGSVSGKANILSDSIILTYQTDGVYKFEIGLTDQMGNQVIGSYESSFNTYQVKSDSITSIK